MHNPQPNLSYPKGTIDELAISLIQAFDCEAALIAWGHADTEADRGDLELAQKWLCVMETIMERQPVLRPTRWH